MIHFQISGWWWASNFFNASYSSLPNLILWKLSFSKKNSVKTHHFSQNLANHNSPRNFSTLVTPIRKGFLNVRQKLKKSQIAWRNEETIWEMQRGWILAKQQSTIINAMRSCTHCGRHLWALSIFLSKSFLLSAFSSACHQRINKDILVLYSTFSRTGFPDSGLGKIHAYLYKVLDHKWRKWCWKLKIHCP